MKYLLSLHLFSIVFLVRCSNASKTVPDKNLGASITPKPIDLNAVKSENTKANMSPYNGLYLSTWNQSGAMLLFDGKQFHFNKNEFISFYKDEEYDLDGINEEDMLQIVRSYRIDRHDKKVGKDTKHYETKVIMDNGKCIRLERLGRKFIRMETFRDFLNELSNTSVSAISDSVISKYNRSQAEIDKALDDTLFYKNPILIKTELRSGDIYFADIVEAIIKK